MMRETNTIAYKPSEGPEWIVLQCMIHCWYDNYSYISSKWHNSTLNFLFALLPTTCFLLQNIHWIVKHRMVASSLFLYFDKSLAYHANFQLQNTFTQKMTYTFQYQNILKLLLTCLINWWCDHCMCYPDWCSTFIQSFSSAKKVQWSMSRVVLPVSVRYSYCKDEKKIPRMIRRRASWCNNFIRPPG